MRGGRAVRHVIGFYRNFSLGPTLVGPKLRTLRAAPLGCKYGLFSLVGHPRVAMGGVSRCVAPLGGLLGSVSSEGSRVVRTTRILVGCRKCVREREIVTSGVRELRDVGVGKEFSCEGVGSLSARTERGLRGVDPRALTRTKHVPKISPDSVGMLLILLNE